MEEGKGLQESSETGGALYPPAEEGRRGPTWRGWVLSILAAVILSVTATLLLGGSFAGRSEQPGAAGSGCGGPCCPPVNLGK